MTLTLVMTAVMTTVIQLGIYSTSVFIVNSLATNTCRRIFQGPTLGAESFSHLRVVVAKPDKCSSETECHAKCMATIAFGDSIKGQHSL